ncbi:major Facilitator Superfamily protein [Burkholderia pseudomallei 576]|nr:major Facilitator Superfamily protein [Burkholderia pseudomallei 576]EEC38110.1 MFS transporter [Burkholderia pseudomallei 576]KGD29963.1 major Facilitator Superfamily protein [Burkholderia pseudomallei]
MNRLPIAFRRLALSNLAAQSAEQIGLAVAPLVAVLSLGASASGTGLLQTAQTLPFLLLSIPLGVWADRHSRKRIMAAAEGLRALALAATLALLAAHALTLPSLAMLGFVGACGTVAYSVAAPALIPALVGRAALARANGAIELARSAAYSAGPAIGAALVDRIGAQWAYGFAAALSAHAVLLIVRLPDVRAPAAPRKRFVAELLDGARFVRRDRHLRPMIVTAVFFNVGFFTLQAVYVPYAVRHLALGASQIGMTFAAYGIGMMGGAALASAIARRVRFGVVLTIGPWAVSLRRSSWPCRSSRRRSGSPRRVSSCSARARSCGASRRRRCARRSRRRRCSAACARSTAPRPTARVRSARSWALSSRRGSGSMRASGHRLAAS